MKRNKYLLGVIMSWMDYSNRDGIYILEKKVEILEKKLKSILNKIKKLEDYNKKE